MRSPELNGRTEALDPGGSDTRRKPRDDGRWILDATYARASRLGVARDVGGEHLDDMASELDILLDKVDDPALRADLKRQVEALRAKRRFGLVYEEHLPERVQLPEHTVRRGTRVVLRDHGDDEPREVVDVVKKEATVRWADDLTPSKNIAWRGSRLAGSLLMRASGATITGPSP